MRNFAINVVSVVILLVTFFVFALFVEIGTCLKELCDVTHNSPVMLPRPWESTIVRVSVMRLDHTC